MDTRHYNPAGSRPPTRAGNAAETSIAMRVYAICVTRGYVDDHDWIEVSRQVRAEQAAAAAQRRRRTAARSDARL